MQPTHADLQKHIRTNTPAVALYLDVTQTPSSCLPLMFVPHTPVCLHVSVTTNQCACMFLLQQPSVLACFCYNTSTPTYMPRDKHTAHDIQHVNTQQYTMMYTLCTQMTHTPMFGKCGVHSHAYTHVCTDDDGDDGVVTTPVMRIHPIKTNKSTRKKAYTSSINKHTCTCCF